eukprot:COSAG06_NODE_50576_length_317_cov_6.701835_1_plen_61_part_01
MRQSSSAAADTRCARNPGSHRVRTVRIAAVPLAMRALFVRRPGQKKIQESQPDGGALKTIL